MDSPRKLSVPNNPSRLLGPLVTVIIIAVVELMSIAGFRLPNPPAFLVLAIVFSAFISGFIPGLISAGIAWLYLPYFFPPPVTFSNIATLTGSVSSYGVSLCH